MTTLQELIQKIGKNNAAIKKYAFDSLKEFREEETKIDDNTRLSDDGKRVAKDELRHKHQKNAAKFIGKLLKENEATRAKAQEISTNILADVYSATIDEEQPRAKVFKRQLDDIQFDIATKTDKAEPLERMKELANKYGDDASYLNEIKDATSAVASYIVEPADLLELRKVRQLANDRMVDVGDETKIANELIDNVEVLQDELYPNDERSMSATAALKQTFRHDEVKKFVERPAVLIDMYDELFAADEPADEQDEVKDEQKPQTLDEMNEILSEGDDSNSDGDQS